MTRRAVSFDHRPGRQLASGDLVRCRQPCEPAGGSPGCGSPAWGRRVWRFAGVDGPGTRPAFGMRSRGECLARASSPLGPQSQSAEYAELTAASSDRVGAAGRASRPNRSPWNRCRAAGSRSAGCLPALRPRANKATALHLGLDAQRTTGPDQPFFRTRPRRSSIRAAQPARKTGVPRSWGRFPGDAAATPTRSSDHEAKAATRVTSPVHA
jgi:hypothetical protein